MTQTQFHQTQTGADLDPDQWQERHRALFDYWHSIAPGENSLLPGRRHFDPLAVPRLLPYLILYDVERQPRLRLRFRLVGTMVGQWIGTELTGYYTDEVSDVSELMQVLAPAIEQGQGVWRRWPRLLRSAESFSVMEALLLPLAEDGRQVDMLVGLYQAGDIDGRPL